MRFNINLATRTYIDARKANAVLAAVIIILSAALLFAVSRLSSNAGQINRLEADLNKGATSKQEVPAQEYQAVLSRIRFANGVIEQKTFNWLGLLNRLETVVPEGVALTAVQPDIRKNELRLSGAARNFRNLRKFMETLEDSKIFTDVYLLGQGMAKTENMTGITFNISCQVDFKKL